MVYDMVKMFLTLFCDSLKWKKFQGEKITLKKWVAKNLPGK